MGPRPFSRGNDWPVSQLGVLADRLQWGRGLSAAEMSRCTASSHVAATSFNGAAAFQPRKFASDVWSARRAQSGFNGAAAFQPRKCYGDRRQHPWIAGWLQWGRGLSAAEMRFARDRVQPNRATASMGPRPFSRGNIQLASRICRCRHHASMGPRPFSRGNARDFARAVRLSASFNGAAAFQPRK